MDGAVTLDRFPCGLLLPLERRRRLGNAEPAVQPISDIATDPGDDETMSLLREPVLLEAVQMGDELVFEISIDRLRLVTIKIYEVRVRLYGSPRTTECRQDLSESRAAIGP